MFQLTVLPIVALKAMSLSVETRTPLFRYFFGQDRVERDASNFLTVTFSILYILTDHDLFGSDIEQDCSYTVFGSGFFTLTKHSIFL